jgi:hypothetical protein
MVDNGLVLEMTLYTYPVYNVVLFCKATVILRTLSFFCKATIFLSTLSYIFWLSTSISRS